MAVPGGKPPLRRKLSDVGSFKELSKRDAIASLAMEIRKLMATVQAGMETEFRDNFDGFSRLFSRWILSSGPALEWSSIKPLPGSAVKNYDELVKPIDDQLAQNILSKLVVVKLNGGLGTSMGCTGPKSLISVRNDLTFLDLNVQQIESLNVKYNVDVPLVLMNSFNTDEDSAKALRKYAGFRVNIHSFNQSRYPRINKETLMPMTTSCTGDADDSWYPPGHGDFYESFVLSGLLDQFIEQGKTYCFVSNIDNLGATVDLNILNLLVGNEQQESPEYVMEVTDKTRADVKGGTLCWYEDKLKLLEIAQVPKEHVDEFKSVNKFKIFNTNNLWINLEAISRNVKAKTLQMEIIVNHKTLDNGVNVIQLETAAGTAIKNFEGSIGVNVPRSRFLPVKKTSDLLIVMSNLYKMHNGTLKMSPDRAFPSVPLVKLGDNHFAKVREFLGRFASVPDMIELDHLTVSGDVTFGKGVALKGTVIIIANHGDRIDIPPGAILENKIVSGNLRIMDH
ncbi:PREDICTED: UTP--glucose-1-phosphate uridylyltransferase-like [Priapulus caudatus]|uniref:UTP--glucose-1-phosphate uridylyltransferase n=1 Tax=Priapulus caudatus TaxID=37621 RepID=A0ABM1EAA2_PRICU|nr:PREDICTED: UTP--glucose-1-phosphate uridylyltransferase-like [Priapulus caudatus]